MQHSFSAAVVRATLLALTLGACGGGGGGGASGNPATQPSFVQIYSGRLDGGPATQFDFDAQILGGETPTNVAWDFGDGQTGSGASVQVTYGTPGVYTVRVTASFPIAGNVSSELDISVLDPQGGAVLVGTDVPMPALLGDLDGDLVLTQLDVDRIFFHLLGVMPLDSNEWRAADYHLDGRIDQLDLDLLTTAVSQGGALPDSIEPRSGPRGTMMRVVSGQLLDVDALIEVRVGAAPPRALRRLHPGYGVFVIPMDAVGAPTIAPIVEGWTPIELLVNGFTVHAFDFTLTNPPTIVGDEVAMLRSSGQELRQAALDLRDALADDFDVLGTSADDRRVLRAMLDFAASRFADAAAQIHIFTAQLTPQRRNNLAYMCNVAGLRESRSAVQALVASPGGIAGLRAAGTGSAKVDLLYGLNAILEFADALNNVTQAVRLTTTGAAALSSLALGPIGLSIGANVRAACASMDTAASVVSALKAWWPKLNGDLVVNANEQFGTIPTTYTVHVEAPFQRSDVCGNGISMAEVIQSLVLQRLSSKLGVLSSFQILSSIPFDQSSGVMRQPMLDDVRAFLQALGGVFSYALDAPGLTQWLQDLKTPLCPAPGSNNSISIRNAELQSLTLNPSNGGTLSQLPGGAEFQLDCAPGVPSSVALQASLAVTGGPVLVGSKTLSCVGGCPGAFPTPPRMAAIQAGTFQRGSNASCADPYWECGGSQPVHQVTISYCFWMGQYEVTQSEYAALMGSNPSSVAAANNPVDGVSWTMARAYCAALTAQQSARGNVPGGYQYRLPTEAEWEYACRSGTTTEFNVGGALFCNQASFHFSNHSNSPCNPNYTSLVGSYAPNAWGLYDMHGNVWEWCLDSHAPYVAGPATDPFRTGGPSRIQRGGSWGNPSDNCRSAVRNFGGPGSTNSTLGFRVVLAPILNP